MSQGIADHEIVRAALSLPWMSTTALLSIDSDFVFLMNHDGRSIDIIDSVSRVPTLICQDGIDHVLPVVDSVDNTRLTRLEMALVFLTCGKKQHGCVLSLWLMFML